MADTKIKPQHHPAKSFFKSPLFPYFLVPSCPHKGPWGLGGYKSIMQNKANFTMGNINISTAQTKAYAKEQRTMNNKRYPKQTQSNPIHHGEAGFCPCPNRQSHPDSAPIFPPPAQSAIRNPALSGVEGTRYAILP